MDKPTTAEQLEHHSSGDKEHSEDLKESGEADVLDEERNKKLNRRLDIRVLPLCAWVYLLNFLDRGAQTYTSSLFHEVLTFFRKYW